MIPRERLTGGGDQSTSWPGGGRFPYKSDKDGRRLALGCKLQILVSLGVFGMERHYSCPYIGIA